MEGKRSLQDRPKPLHYAENKQRFARFASKIIHVTVDTDPQDKARYRCLICKSLCHIAQSIPCMSGSFVGASVLLDRLGSVLCGDSHHYHPVSQHLDVLTVDRSV